MTSVVRFVKQLCLIVAISIVLPPRARAQDLEFDYLAISTVAPINMHKGVAIRGATQDGEGFIWLGTNNGVFRFDGVSFHPFARSINDQIVPYLLDYHYLHVASNGDLWIVNADRDLLQISKDGRIATKHSLPGSEQAKRIKYGNMLFAGDSVVWITTADSRLHSYNWYNKSWTTFKAPHPAGADEDLTFGNMLVDPHDSNLLWIGSKYGLYCFNQQEIHFNFFGLEEPYRYYLAEQLTPLHFFNHKVLMGGPDGLGIDIFDIANEQWLTRLKSAPDKGRNESLLSFATIGDSMVIGGLFAFEGLAFITINSSGAFDYQVKFYDTEFGTLNHLYNFMISNTGSLRAVTSRGITRISRPDRNFSMFRLTASGELRNNWQRSFLQLDDPHKFLLGTFRGDGLFEIDWNKRTKRVIPFKSSKGLLNHDVSMWSMAMDNENYVWIGSDEGLLRADLANEQILQPDYVKNNEVLSSTDIHFLHFDNPVLWIATSDHGIYQMDVEQKSILQADNTIVRVNCLLPQQDLWWVGTDRGLMIWNPEEVAWVPGENLMPDIALTDFCRIGDSVWIASKERGLWCMTQNESGQWAAQSYMNPEVYTSNYLHKLIHVAGRDQLWLNTHYGYTSFDLLTHRFTNYTLDDGIRFSEKNGAIFAALYDGAIISGANRYFQFFYPDSVQKSVDIPVPYLEEVSSGGNSISYDREGELVFPAGTNNISFAVGGLNFNTAPVNYYSFRFGGPFADWSPWTINNNVHYEYLRGGEYEFAYRVANKIFDQSEVKTVEVKINKKPSETLAFKLAGGVVLAGLIYLLFLYRSRQEKRESQIREEYQKQINELQMSALQLQMNPHFVFNSINSINYYIIQNERDKASTYLAKFSRLIRLILENSKLEFISLEQELEAIALYLEIERMRFEGKFDFEIEADENVHLENVQIPPLILQPYVENSIWHGFMQKDGPGYLSIFIRDGNGFVRCIIEDDGIGREAAERLNANKGMRKQSLGTKITKDRLAFVQEKYGVLTDVEICDLTNLDGTAAGTRVTVKIPKLNREEL